MVSQPGVGQEAGRILKQLCGTLYDGDNNALAGKNPNAPFKTEIQAYRFCAMVGLALDRRTNDGLIQTKWAVESIHNAGETKFEQLFSIAGRETDYTDWVDSMNRCADWGSIYISKYYFIGGVFKLSHLIGLLNSAMEFTECAKCGAFGDSENSDEICWKCGG